MVPLRYASAPYGRSATLQGFHEWGEQVVGIRRSGIRQSSTRERAKLILSRIPLCFRMWWAKYSIFNPF